jgi:hypothetical protein
MVVRSHQVHIGRILSRSVLGLGWVWGGVVGDILSEEIAKAKRAAGMAQLVEHLPSKGKAMSSTFSTIKINK